MMQTWCYSLYDGSIQSTSSEQIAARLAEAYMFHAIYFQAELSIPEEE